ncbi:MAG: 3-deoxy-D-manno-octulosonic acid kinase [Gammaproteobacteria bacterium]
MQEIQANSPGERILYDADAAERVDRSWFNPAARGWLTGNAQGRGQALFFRHRETEYVLRHYRRGGAVAAVLGDRYFYTGLHRTRAWREWGLLARVTALGLPAPRPLAARVVIAGLFYRADLITYRLMDTRPLSEILKHAPLPQAAWREVGRVIARFHDAHVCHADLNAHNVMLDARGEVALIDFDRARFRRSAARWRRANLVRLHRSLRKLKRLNPALNFSASDFEALRAGYGSLD